MAQEKTAAAENAATRYLAYAQRCNCPGAVSILSRQINAVKTAEVSEPIDNTIKIASIEERLVDMVIEKYAATEPKEKVLEMAKELGKLLDEGEITEEDLTPENLETLKNTI
jgi:hypothetical protein